MEALVMIDFVMPGIEMKILLALKREDMSYVMGHIRLANNLGMLDRKLELICN